MIYSISPEALACSIHAFGMRRTETLEGDGDGHISFGRA
jgi:hypothetical protein